MIVRESNIIPNLGDREICICQQRFCQLHFSLKDIGFQRNAGRFLEKCRNILFIISKISSYFADLDWFPDAPGDIVDDVGVELLFIAFHGDAPAGQVELAVELTQDPGYRIVVLIDIPVVPVAVLKLFEKHDHPVDPRDFSLHRQQDPGLLSWQGSRPRILYVQVIVAARIGKMRPVKSTL